MLVANYPLILHPASRIMWVCCSTAARSCWRSLLGFRLLTHAGICLIYNELVAWVGLASVLCCVVLCCVVLCCAASVTL